MGALGVLGAFGADSKESHAGLGVGCVEGGGGNGNTFSFPKWVCEDSRGRERLRFVGVVI